MSTKKAQKQSKLIRFVTLPIRALGKAKDLYVRSLMDCAPKVSHGGYPSSTQLPVLPKSFSSGSCKSNETDDFRELVKAASVRNLEMKEMDGIGDIRESKGRLPKSCSLGMGRIDEDGAEEIPDLVYPRSRSYAVTKSKAGF